MSEFQLGVQSYCFREFQSLSSLIDCLECVGLSRVELWPGHLDFRADADAVRHGLGTFEENGIAVDAYGTVRFDTDRQAARKCLSFCRQAGVKAVTAGDVVPAAYEMMEELCEEFDLELALHNHGRNHRLGTYRALQEVFEQTSPRFGLCLDTAWALDAGEDPLEAVQRFGDRLYGVHLKDFVFDDEGNPEDVIIGEGGLELAGLMDALDEADFDGYLSLEYEGNPEDPLDEVQQCVRIVEAQIARLRRRSG